MKKVQRAQSFDQPSSYATRAYAARYGYPTHKEAWSETNSVRSPTPNQYIFDEKPQLKTSRSTTTLQRVKGAFENRYGPSRMIPSSAVM